MAFTFSGVSINGSLRAAYIPPPTVVTASDAYFMYTTLLLSGNGTNNATNATFLDSSTNNFTITRNGNTTQGTFSPYGGNWSNYFDGNGDYLSITGSALDASTTSNYTIEFWMHTRKTANVQMIYELGTGATNDLQVYVSATALVFQVDGNTPSATVSFTDDTWVHVACVNVGGNLTTYINGVGTSVDTGVTITSKTTAYIGMRTGTILPFTGYLSNMRVTRAAVYTSNFTPSTTPLTAIANTALLTCADNRFIDDSTNNFTIARFGNVSVERFSPFSPTAAYSTSTIGGSGYFDGSGDYLLNTGTTAGQLGSGNFTFECWYYPTTATFGSGGASNYAGIFFDSRSSAGDTNGICFFTNTNGTVTAYSGSVIFTSSTAMKAFGWNHIAFVRTGSTVTCYINGESSGTFSSSANFASGRLQISGPVDYTPGYIEMVGYGCDHRIVKGTAVYTANFTPPTAPLTAIANTSILLNYTNAGIIDNTMMNNLETVGNAQISTTQSKFGGSSISFDGTGDALYSTSQATIFGTGNFTIEFWIYFNIVNNGTVKYIYDMRNSGATSSSFLAQEASSAWSYWNGAGTEISTGFTSSTFSATTWTHVAICRSSGVTKFFVNGTQTNSVVDTSNYANSTLVVGARYNYANELNGYIDDLRITKGYARYTSNFTPPTAALETN